MANCVSYSVASTVMAYFIHIGLLQLVFLSWFPLSEFSSPLLQVFVLVVS